MAYWYGYVSGDPLSPTSYRLLPDYEDGFRPQCLTGCRICAILLNVNAPPPTNPPAIPLDIQEIIAIGLAEGTPQRLPSGPLYRVLLRC